MLTLDISAYTLPKDGSSVREYEDAFAFDVEVGRVAVADGASDAFEAGTWARLLVTSVVYSPLPAGSEAALIEWLQAPARAWHAFLRWEQLPWYAEEKARTIGGLATLVGLAFERNEAGDVTHWHAMAVGDACLMHIRDDLVLKRFPFEETDAFDTTPDLLSTRMDHNERFLTPGTLRRCQGDCRAGDRFLLATDAVAQWLYGIADLEDPMLGLPDWDDVLGVVDQDFASLIDELRRRSVMRNDDVTLLIVQVVDREPAAPQNDDPPAQDIAF